MRQRPLQPRRLHLQPPPAPPVSPCRVPIGPLGAETDRAAGPAFSASSSSARERTVGGRARPSASRASVASIAARRSAGSSEKMLSRPPCPPAPPRSVLCPLPRAIAPAPAPARARAPARADSGRAGGRAVCGRGARSVAANWFLRSARYPPRAAESVPPWGKPQYRLGRGGTDRAAAGRGADADVSWCVMNSGVVAGAGLALHSATPPGEAKGWPLEPLDPPPTPDYGTRHAVPGQPPAATHRGERGGPRALRGANSPPPPPPSLPY